MKKNGTNNKNPPVFAFHCLKFKAHKRDKQRTTGITFYPSLKLGGRMYQGSEEIQINWGEMKWSNKIQNNDNLHKLRCFTVSRWMKGNIKQHNKRCTKDTKREKNNVFFFCDTGHIGSSLQNQTYENKTYEKKTLVTSLDLLLPFLQWRKEKRYVAQLGFLS